MVQLGLIDSSELEGEQTHNSTNARNMAASDLLLRYFPPQTSCIPSFPNPGKNTEKFCSWLQENGSNLM